MARKQVDHSKTKTPGKGQTKRLNVDVPIDIFVKFKIKATMEDRPMTEIVNEMLVAYLKTI